DNVILNWMIDEFKKENGIDLRNDKMALQRLRDAAEKAKIELSGTTQTEINQPFITMDATGPKHLALTLTRGNYENLASNLIERTVAPCVNALKDAGLSKTEINEVILVGGMSRMPAVQAKVKEIFGREPHKGVNPDEVVALGAAIQGGVLGGDVKDVLLLDVVPLTLGIETMGGVLTPLIERNTTIPTQKKQIFSTAADNQPAVTINVYQGERKMVADSKLIGTFNLEGITPAPRGMPQIEVAFDIDADGILKVSAEDKGSGKKQDITIQHSSGLTDEEIEKAVKDAEAHAEEDKKAKEAVDTKNEADALIFRAEKSLSEYKEKIPAALSSEIQSHVDKLKETIKTGDIAAIKAETEKLNTHLQKIGEEISKQQQAAGGAQSQPEAEKKDDIEEADVEIMDGEEKK
ncbi:MAG TPA: Hsp70 family protein, partial [Chlamydiales bacterium]|nr:Hsp70 family protein [Chlamydiales bacterium]